MKTGFTVTLVESPNVPIIGVGGIVDAERALASLRAGADLIQIYTGFALRGHVLLEEIWSALLAHRRGGPNA